MKNLSQMLAGLGAVRLIMMAGAGLGLVLFFLFLSSRLGTPNMALLYGDLDPADASKIIGKLESMNVPYELRGNGGQIMVPSDQALRLRMSMAQEGLPSGGSIGYEIFDRSESLGTTNFVQNVNLLRALEGELARTIRSISAVQEARVHLVMPKRELFSRRKQEPSASVLLRVRGNDRLGKDQIQAVQHIVSAAVPGLKPSHISVVDTAGRLLARGGGERERTNHASANNEDMRRVQEDRMSRVIEELVERYVGYGNVRAHVTAQMNFDRITTNSESYNPDQQVVRSTQTVEERNSSRNASTQEPVTVTNNLPDQAASSSPSEASDRNLNERSEETVNFEISKTVRNHVRETGNITRLSVAVMINGKYETDEDGNQTYKPRGENELAKLSSLIRSTIGYDEKRGDRVELINMQFASTGEGLEAAEEPLFGLQKGDYFRIAELLVLAVVGTLVILLVVRPLVTRTLDALPSALASAREQNLLADQTADGGALSGPDQTGVSGAILDEQEDELIDVDLVEGRVKSSTIRKMNDIVDKHPEETVSIIRQWMYQDA